MCKLRSWEIPELIKYLPYSTRQQYEQTRLLLWGSLSPYMKHKKSPKDILPLSTDNEGVERIKDKPLEIEKQDQIRAQIEKIWLNKNGKQA